MALISLQAPSYLLTAPVPGTKESSATLHITVCYLGDNVPVQSILNTYNILIETLAAFPSFTVTSDYIAALPSGKKGIPVVALVDSPLLYVLRDKVYHALRQNNISFVDTYKTYRPHVTLSYSDVLPPRIPLGTSWNINKVNIWPFDSGNTGEISVYLNRGLLF